MKQYLLLSILILSVGIKESKGEEPRLHPVEKIWVPDSVFSPYYGWDHLTVWWWQYNNGIRQDKPPYKNMEEMELANDYLYYENEKTNKNTPVDSTKIPKTPDYFSWKHFQYSRLGKPDDATLWFEVKDFEPTDPDTADALYYYKKDGTIFNAANTRYYLYQNGNLIGSFIALNDWMSSGNIANMKSWDSGYSFIFQRAERIRNSDGIWERSIHAVINGEDLNQRGYDKTLAPTFLDGELFFVFNKHSKWGWFYNDTEHPNVWDDVYYQYDAGDGILGPNSYPTWKGITALRDGMWYMVKFEKDIE